MSLRSEASTRSIMRSIAQQRARGPPTPSVPLIAPVPAPLREERRGRSVDAGVEDASAMLGGDSAAAMRYAALRAQGGAQAQATLRMLIADMMLGMQDEHGSTLAHAASQQASASRLV